ncbi:hypothetical protein F5Y06DRAFT_297214 [Hypoxylon sp. FL0890]|nr:hypothetical protein F5Y06DRAFT_297214 [Hypoxylon sp. FL0890]
MGVFTQILMVGLLALCHIANCAVIPANKQQGLAKDSSNHVKKSIPLTTVSVDSERVTFVSTSVYPLSTLATVHHHSSHHIRTTRSIESVSASSSHSSSTRPTRTGQDTTRPRTYYVTSYGHSPIMTEIPRDCEAAFGPGEFEDAEISGCLLKFKRDSVNDEYDDTELSPRDYDDGYGYGYGSSTAPAVGGGYGSPPGPTDLPPGGYGNQQPPAVVTVPDPVTVTVSLSSATQSTPTIVAPVIVTETITSASVTHSAVEQVTVTVTASKSTLSLSLSSTPLVPTGISQSTEGYVYTTVTASSSLTHTASSTSSITYTPTARPTPKPVTDTNASETAANVDWLLMIGAGALAYAALWIPTVHIALALVVGCMGALFADALYPLTWN